MLFSLLEQRHRHAFPTRLRSTRLSMRAAIRGWGSYSVWIRQTSFCHFSVAYTCEISFSIIPSHTSLIFVRSTHLHRAYQHDPSLEDHRRIGSILCVGASSFDHLEHSCSKPSRFFFWGPRNQRNIRLRRRGRRDCRIDGGNQISAATVQSGSCGRSRWLLRDQQRQSQSSACERWNLRGESQRRLAALDRLEIHYNPSRCRCNTRIHGTWIELTKY